MTGVYIFAVSLFCLPLSPEQGRSATQERLERAGIQILQESCAVRFARIEPRLLQPHDQGMSIVVPTGRIPAHIKNIQNLAMATSAARYQHVIDDLGLMISRGGSGKLDLTEEYSLDGVVRDIAQLPQSVTSLSCPYAELNDDQVRMIVVRLKHLRCLELGGNPITDRGLKELSSLTHLCCLDLSDTLITGNGLGELKRLTSLRCLSLGGCRISDAQLAALIDELPHLRMVFLHHTQCGVKTVKHLVRHDKLRVIDLAGTRLDDDSVRHLFNVGTLEELFLDQTSVSDDAFAHDLPPLSLKLLSVRGTGVSQTVIKRLRAEKLEVVDDNSDRRSSRMIEQRLQHLRKNNVSISDSPNTNTN